MRRRVVRRRARVSAPPAATTPEEIDQQLVDMRQMLDRRRRDQQNTQIDTAVAQWNAYRLLRAQPASGVHDCESAQCRKRGRIDCISRPLALYGCVDSGLYHRCVSGYVCSGGSTVGHDIGMRYAALHRGWAEETARGVVHCVFSGRHIGVTYGVDSAQQSTLSYEIFQSQIRNYRIAEVNPAHSTSEWTANTPRDQLQRSLVPALVRRNRPSASISQPTMPQRPHDQDTRIEGMVRETIQMLLQNRTARQRVAAAQLEQLRNRYTQAVATYTLAKQTHGASPCLVEIVGMWRAMHGAMSALDVAPRLTEAEIVEIVGMVQRGWALILRETGNRVDRKKIGVRTSVIGLLYCMRNGVSAKEDAARTTAGQTIGSRPALPPPSRVNGPSRLLADRIQRPPSPPGHAPPPLLLGSGSWQDKPNAGALLWHTASDPKSRALVLRTASSGAGEVRAEAPRIVVVPKVKALAKHLPPPVLIGHFGGGLSTSAVTDGMAVVCSTIKTTAIPPRLCAQIIRGTAPMPSNTTE